MLLGAVGVRRAVDLEGVLFGADAVGGEAVVASEAAPVRGDTGDQQRQLDEVASIEGKGEIFCVSTTAPSVAL